MAADWLKIRNEYVNGSISYRKLAEKYGLNKDTIAQKAKAEQWQTIKKKQADKIQTETLQKTADVIIGKEVDRITRILSAADLLLARVEEAAGQLDTHIITNKVKTKKVTYNNKCKATKEINTEEEIKDIVAGPVDRAGLQQVAAALKSIKDTVQAVDGGGGGDGDKDENMLALADIIRQPVPDRNVEDFENEPTSTIQPETEKVL